jgi:hypothetical protein
MSAFPRPAQPVDATQALNLSAGVSNCKGLTWSFVELIYRRYRINRNVDYVVRQQR